MKTDKFLKNNFIFISGTLIGSFLGYLFHFAVSRYVSVDQYGEVQSLVAFLAIFSFFNGALSYFAIKHIAVFADHEDHAAVREFYHFVENKILKLSLLFLTVIVLISPIFKNIFHFSSSWGIMIMGLGVFFSTLSVIYQEILRGFSQFLILSIIGVVAALAKLVSGAGLAIIFGNSSAIAVSLFFSVFVIWFLARIYSQKRINLKRGETSGSSWRKKYFSDRNLKKTAFQILFFSLGLVLISSLDVILVKYFTSPDLAGYYGAYSLLGKIIFFISGAIIAVILPGACAQGYLGQRPDKTKLSLSYFLIISTGLIMIAAYYFFPNLVVNFFFGKKFIFETSSLWLFGMASLALSVLTLEANLAFARHDFRIVYLLVATAAAMIVGIFLCHSTLGEIALILCVIFLASFLLTLLLNLNYKGAKQTAEYD